MKIKSYLANKMNASKILPFLVSIIPPSVFLLYLYQRNAALLSFLHVLIAIAVFTGSAVVLHLFVSKLVKSSRAAALINNVLWMLFFMMKIPYKFIVNYFANKLLVPYIGIMIALTVIVILVIVRHKRKLQKPEVFKIVSVFWLVVFLFNAIPSFVYAAKSSSKNIGYNENNYKIEFNVDTSLPSPNIYWLFMDGMLGFKAMEYFFDDPQTEFTAQLTERGFQINREAQFEALHSTVYSIPALMCPHFYDEYFVQMLRRPDIDDYIQKMNMHKDGELIMSSALARSRNELAAAFGMKGYQTGIIAIATFNDFGYFYPSTESYYQKNKKISVEAHNPVVFINLHAGKKLLYETTILSKFTFVLDRLFFTYGNVKLADIPQLPPGVYESFFGESYQGNDKWYIDALADIMSESEPRLVIIHEAKAHVPFIYDEYGRKNIRKLGPSDPYNYPPQHYFASTIVISYIDYILTHDPDAVIVLQSDHGLHSSETRRQLISKYGKTDEDVRLMQNQTISAVRIPEKWGGGGVDNQEVESLNITRLLVNRYVGENYTLLDSEDIIR